VAFSVTLRQGAAIEIINKLKFAVTKAKVFPHLETFVRVKRGIPHAKNFVGLSALSYSKE
jgi:hypothetical protein